MADACQRPVDGVQKTSTRKSSCLRSIGCCYVSVLFGLIFLVAGGFATHFYIRFTPIYKDIGFEFTEPKLLGSVFTFIAFQIEFSIPLAFKNPNIFPIVIYESKGDIIASSLQKRLGGFTIPETYVEPETDTVLDVKAQLLVNLFSFQEVIEEIRKNEVIGFWFIAESIKGEARPDLMVTELNITMELQRACAADFNISGMNIVGDVFCSEDVTLLKERVPAGDLAPPEDIEYYERQKDSILWPVMVLGHALGAALLCLAALTLRRRGWRECLTCRRKPGFEKLPPTPGSVVGPSEDPKSGFEGTAVEPVSIGRPADEDETKKHMAEPHVGS